MNTSISNNTQAILLLTAPLIIGRNERSFEMLTPSEYNRVARFLNHHHREPADLLGPEANELIINLQTVVDDERLLKLLGRGFLLGQAVERWQARAIWIVSRADPNYPKRLKNRLKDWAPALLYGSGDDTILESGGLAIVGSREVADELISYTESVSKAAAKAHQTVVSGGARGIDRAAMFGALQNDGRVIEVLADSLERMVLTRDNRDHLLEKRLVLVSPYDPLAGFDVGHAMQRNKIIYAFSDAALIVNSDFEKGGTWSGAIEQLEKMHLVPIYIRSNENVGKGLKALKEKGALIWPNPETPEEFAGVYTNLADRMKEKSLQEELPLPVCENLSKIAESDLKQESEVPIIEKETNPLNVSPAELLLAKVKELILQMNKQITEDTVSEELQISLNQTKDWLKRLTSDGVLVLKQRPKRYIIVTDKQENLFEGNKKE